MYLNGADVYSGCCSLKVDYAPNRYLRISHNTNDQWDSSLEEEVGQITSGRDMSSSLLGGPPAGLMPPLYSSQDNYNSNASPSMMNYMDPYARGGARYQSGANSNPGHMLSDPTGGGGNYCGTYSRDGRYDSGSMTSIPPGALAAASPVVLIYGLEMNEANCDRIFNFACLYGNVLRVKFLHSKEGSCMVQMGDEIAAQNLAENFNGVYLFNKRISVQISKQPILQPVINPYTLPDGSLSYKDFSNSSLNRFFTRDRAMKNRICRPSGTLHFWNCPPSFHEVDVIQLFDYPNIVKPNQVLFFNQNEKSNNGLIEWVNPGDALNALAVLNHKLIVRDDGNERANNHHRDGNKDSTSPWYIKLSFGVNPIKSRTGNKPQMGIY